MTANRPNHLADDLKKLAKMYQTRGRSEEAQNTLLLANQASSEQDSIAYGSAFAAQSDEQNNDQRQA